MTLLRSLIGATNTAQKPLHAGEVMGLWAVTLALAEGRVLLQGFLNHTADPELKRYMEQYITDFEMPWIDRFQQFMLKEGLPLPAQTPDKPKALEEDIPIGGKFTDVEITTLLASKLVAAMQVVHQATIQCLRYDLGTMLLDLQVAGYKQSFVLREMMERRGWLQVPPYWPVAKRNE